MPRLIEAQYIKTYYKTITRTIEVSGMLDDNEVYDYVDEHFPKEEVDNASLVLEDWELILLNL